MARIQRSRHKYREQHIIRVTNNCCSTVASYHWQISSWCSQLWSQWPKSLSGTRTSDHRGIHHGRRVLARLDLAALRVKLASHQTGTEHSQDIVVTETRFTCSLFFLSTLQPSAPVHRQRFSAPPKKTPCAHGPLESCSQGVKPLPTIHVNSLTVCSNEQLKVRLILSSSLRS